MKTKILAFLMIIGMCFSTVNTFANHNTIGSGDLMSVNLVPWNYINTGTNHTIFIPVGSVVMGGQSISIGDYIGVFYDQAGVLTCGGYSEWDGTTGAVAAWGSFSPGDNGFQVGEVFSWKVWRASDGMVFDMGATYQPIGFPFISGSTYVPNGMSGILALTDQVAPNVSFSGFSGPYCESDPFVTLTGTPSGGVFTGPGITGNEFYPSVAGSGSHNITYTFTSTGGLSNYEVQIVTVNANPIVDLGPDQSVCSPSSLLLDAGINLQYLWGAGETTQTLNVTTTGLYSVTVTDANSCSSSDEINVIVYPETAVSFSGLLANYCSGNLPSVLIGDPIGGVFSGPGISGNNFDPSVAGNGTHTIEYTYIDVNLCTIVEEQTTTVGLGNSIDFGPDQSFCDGGIAVLDAGLWNSYLWSNGGTDQSLNVTTSGTYSVTATDINGCTSEDEIIISVLSLPSSGLNPMVTLIPGQTITLDAGIGFPSYLWNDGTTDQSVQTSYPGEFYVTLEGSNGCFATDTIDVEFDLDAVHIINLPLGWSYFSTYVDPYLPIMTDMLSSIVNDIIIVKNGGGQVYWPAFNLNLIGNHVVGQGYQIKTSNAVSVSISGTMIVPEWNPILFPQGWSIIGYLRYVQGDMVDILSPIVSDVTIVKNGFGQFYWPAFGLNMIGDFIPGEGYLILLSQSNPFVYPWNGMLSKSGNAAPPTSKHFKSIEKSSEVNMSLVIPEYAWESIPDYGDEIAIVNSMGEICGVSVYSGVNTGITIWGNDSFTEENEFLAEDENYFLKLWKKDFDKETVLEVTQWEKGSSKYKTNGLAVVGKIGSNEEINTISTNSYPNPFNTTTDIEITLSKDQNVKVSIINGNGEVIAVLHNDFMTAGNVILNYDGKGLSSGVYYYQILTENNVVTKALIKM